MYAPNPLFDNPSLCPFVYPLNRLSTHPFIPLTIYLPFRLTAYSLFALHFTFKPVYPLTRLSTHLSAAHTCIHLSVYPPTRPSADPSAYVSIRLRVFHTAYPSIHPPVYVPTRLSAHPRISPTTYSSTRLPAHPSILATFSPPTVQTITRLSETSFYGLHVCLPMCLHATRFSDIPSPRLHNYPSNRLPNYLSIRLGIYPPTFLPAKLS